jgi:hypothetical protein
MTAGFHDHLVKPVNLQLLEAIVKRLRPSHTPP